MQNYKTVVGIDEVGRGSWAGPVVAAAVILSGPIEGLKDSKLLSDKSRNLLAEIIKNDAVAYGVGWADIDYLNKFGLTKSISLAMNDAISQINTPYEKIIIDGNYNFLHNNPLASVLISADKLVNSVSAASILAKVARDNWMKSIAKEFPQYGFDKHVGYGTRLHIEKLREHGPCVLHRTFYKPIMSFQNDTYLLKKATTSL